MATSRWRLTPRQSQVLVLLMRGRPSKTIAVELGCAFNTVENHVAALLEKSGCGSRAELAAAGIVLEDRPDGTTLWRRA